MADASQESEAAPSRKNFLIIMSVLLMVEILSSLESSMIVTALPTILKEFKDITSAGWLVSSFLLASAATAAVGGRLGDMFGRRRLLLILIALCAIGSIISALSTNLLLVIFGRTIQGASGAILPLCYGLTRELAPPGKAPLWIGLLTGGYSFAAAIGYILGGYLADTSSWRSVFYLTSVYALLLLPLVWFLIPVTRGAKLSGKFDLLGALLFAPAVAAVLYGITASRSIGWLDAGAWMPFVIGFVVIGIWAWHELRVDNPLMNLRLLKRRPIVVGNACAAVASMSVMQLPFVTLLLLQQPRMAGIGLAVSATMAGFLKLPSNIGSLIAAPLGGWVAGQHGARWSMILGGFIACGGWLGILLFHDSVIQVVGWTVICAFGATVLLSAIPILVLEGTPMENSSEITGLTQVIRSMFAGIGAQIVAVLLATSHIEDPKTNAFYPTETAYQITMLFIAISAAFVAFIAFGVPARKPIVATTQPASEPPIASESLEDKKDISEKEVTLQTYDRKPPGGST